MISSIVIFLMTIYCVMGISWIEYLKKYDGDITIDDESYIIFKRSNIGNIVNPFFHISNDNFSKRFKNYEGNDRIYKYNGFANNIKEGEYFSWYEKGIVPVTVDLFYSNCVVINNFLLSREYINDNSISDFDFNNCINKELYPHKYLNNIENDYDIYSGPLIIELSLNSLSIQYHNPNIIYDGNIGITNYYGLIVGYGRENNILYWIVQLSLGRKWSNDGLFKIKIDSSCINSVY